MLSSRAVRVSLYLYFKASRLRNSESDGPGHPSPKLERDRRSQACCLSASLSDSELEIHPDIMLKLPGRPGYLRNGRASSPAGAAGGRILNYSLKKENVNWSTPKMSFEATMAGCNYEIKSSRHKFDHESSRCYLEHITV